MPTMKCGWWPFLIWLSVPALGQDTGYVGTYDVLPVAPGKTAKEVPGGRHAIAIMDFRKDGSCQMRDMLSGFDGKWTILGKKIVITFTSGPAGKMKKPDVLTFTPAPDRGRLLVTAPQKSAGKLELRWNPKAAEDYNRWLSDVINKGRSAAKKPGG